MTDCYTAALRILSYRFNSEGELRRKLLSRRFPEAEVDAALARLREEKWLDDERFAASFVRSRSSRRVGRVRILRELSAAGVSDDFASRAVAEHVDADSERAALVALCRKKLEVLRRRHGASYLETPEARAKVSAALARSGYETSLVIAVVDELMR